MGIMLSNRVKLSPHRLLELWINDPILLFGGLAEDSTVKLIELLAVLKVGPPKRFAFKLNVVLINEMVPKWLYRQQTLQACIHIAEECIVMKANYPIFKATIIICGVRPCWRGRMFHGG
jgi:hypothetical protein